MAFRASFHFNVKPLHDLTIGDWETLVIAISSAVSVFIIRKQARSMSEQTRIANEQQMASNTIIQIELNRDRQANLVSAWIETENEIIFNKELPTQRMVAKLYVQNFSKLPIYDLNVEITRKTASGRTPMLPVLAYSANPIQVFPPSSEKKWVWQLEVDDLDGGKAQVTDDYFLDSYGPTVDLSQHSLRFGDLNSLGVRIRFRCTDGSTAERDEEGKLI